MALERHIENKERGKKMGNTKVKIFRRTMGERREV
jgi:hypothetical protein